MKRITALIILFSLIIIPRVSAEMYMELSEFYGGSIDFRAAMNSDFIYGSRGDGLRTGGAVSTLDFRHSVSSYNPACLAFPNKTFVSMSLIPASLGADSELIESFTGEGLNTSVDDMLDSTFNDMEGMTVDPGVVLGVQGIAANIGQAPGITGLEAIVPLAENKMSIAFSREEKFTFEFDMILNGMELLVNADEVDDMGNTLVSIAARVKANAVLNLDARNIVTSIGVGRQITPIWGIGAVLELHESRFFVDGRAEVDGAAVFAGNTYEFNTGPHNTLDQTVYGDLTAKAWGIRLGTAVHDIKHTLEAAIDFSIQPVLNYEGRLEAVGHTLPDSISTSDVTLTKEETVDDASKKISIKLPSFMRVSLAWKPGMVLTFNYTHYFDPFYMDFEDGRAFFMMMDAFKLGFNFNYFQFGGGIILANEGLETKDADTNEVTNETVWYPIPTFSMGCVIPWGDYLETEIEFIAVPYPLLKSAVTLNF